MDRGASFMSVTESHGQTNTTNNSMLKGWLTEAQVVAQENFLQWTDCDSQILEGLPSRPHETSYVDAKGHKQYEYDAKT